MGVSVKFKWGNNLILWRFGTPKIVKEPSGAERNSSGRFFNYLGLCMETFNVELFHLNLGIS